MLLVIHYKKHFYDTLAPALQAIIINSLVRAEGLQSYLIVVATSVCIATVVLILDYNIDSVMYREIFLMSQSMEESTNPTILITSYLH